MVVKVMKILLELGYVSYLVVRVMLIIFVVRWIVGWVGFVGGSIFCFIVLFRVGFY